MESTKQYESVLNALSNDESVLNVLSNDELSVNDFKKFNKLQQHKILNELSN